MIYITGDTHGDYVRFTKDNFPEQKHMTKDDFVIICGDFGIWDNSKARNAELDLLDGRPFTTLFVDGNHENYDLLSNVPVQTWHGGNVQFIRPSVIHLMRGQIFDVCGKTFFTMGGARSHDISDGILEPDDPDFKRKKHQLDLKKHRMYRINHKTWWKEELPSPEEYTLALETLAAHNWSVDYIITHCAPTRVCTSIDISNCPDDLTDFLQDISQRCEFSHWFLGHYHDDRTYSLRYTVLYEQIIPLL